jgi:rare lipoprotein A (peptidoglycan hydrolase)
MAQLTENKAKVARQHDRSTIRIRMANSFASISLAGLAILTAMAVSGCGGYSMSNLFGQPSNPYLYSAHRVHRGEYSGELPHTEIVRASWYGQEFANRKTADGERFNPNALTAASRTLPLGSVVRVTNLKNGRSVYVRINDHGPYVHGRGLDLSRRAAEDIGMMNTGVAPVKITPVSEPYHSTHHYYLRKKTRYRYEHHSYASDYQ